MNQDRMAVLGLRTLSGVFTCVAAVSLLAPHLLATGAEISLPSPSALAEFRAGYGGLFAGVATLCFVGARDETHRTLALGIAALVLGLFSGARFLSLVVDGSPNSLAYANHAAETIGFLAALMLWRQRSSR